MKEIDIPHLNYKVGVMTRAHKDMQKQPSCERVSKSKCILWIPKQYKNQVTVIAHEVIHALQFIASDRSIDMIAEQEHMGYLMQYIMARVLGYKLTTI